ncbi:MAG: V-type ATP synthase subunit I [Coprococcus sp.]
MAVLAMKKINICAMKKDRKSILERLQAMGAVEISTSNEENEVFKRTNTTSQKSKYEKRVQNTDAALEILQHYVPEKTSLFASLEGKKEISDDRMKEIIADRGKYNLIVKNIQELNKEIANCKALINKCEVAIEGLTPWLNMDIPINTTGTKTTDVIIGSMGPGLNSDMIEAMVEKRQPELTGYDITVISSDKDQTCIFAICMKQNSAKLEEALRAEGFTRISYFSKRTPKGKVEKYKKNIEEYNSKIEEIKSKLSELAKERDNIRLLSDYYRIRAEKYAVLGELLQSKTTFVITGYILARDEKKIVDELNENYNLMVETEDIPEDETAPVKLENPKAFASAEGVLASFGLPGKGEMDPTTPMCIFYIFLFGLMLSDAAYGLIIFLACFIILKKFPKMSESMAKSIRLFMYCGISTLVWGVLFGGYFGDLITVVSRTFFHHEVVIKPVWFAPLDNPMKMLVFSLLFGLIHLYGGLALKGYMCLKKKDVVGFISDVVSWFMLITGLVMMLMPTELFASIAQMTFNFSPEVKILSYVLAIAGAVIIILMSGRNSKNPVLRFALGLYDIYNLTGWLSDLLSYSRLLALGLATGVIAQVVNQMGSMVGDGVFGVIVFILVFIIGHTFNLAINMLGAYVHTCRLQYVEFFGKFYEGGGIPFNPFKENTKYVDIKEEN